VLRGGGRRGSERKRQHQADRRDEMSSPRHQYSSRRRSQSMV
jgi:hypothetical protein